MTCTSNLPVLACLCLALGMGAAPAAEIHSNGAGGGSWSDPATWRGKAVPGPEDDAVIARGDVVVFDRNDDTVALAESAAAMVGGAAPAVAPLAGGATLLAGTTGKVTCRQLSLDPGSVLTFKSGGKRVLCVTGPVEAYGTIKLDARNAAGDLHELRLVGQSTEQRLLRLSKGGALLLHGRSLADGRRNVLLTSLPQPAVKTWITDAEALGTVESEAGTMIDVQRSELVNVVLKPTGIDNTGARPNERVVIAENRLTGRSRLYLSGCDTPLVANNTLEFTGNPTPSAGIQASGCSLAEIRGNSIRGPYNYGISMYGAVDGAVTDNTIENCSGGIYWYGENGMVRKATIRNCGTGILFTSASGAIDDVTIEGTQTAYYHGGATVQLSSMRIEKPPKDAVAVYYASGPLTLLNCNVAPGQIKFDKPGPPPPPQPPFLVQSMQFLVVGVKGEFPAGTYVEAVTANPAKPLPPGAVDSNIRNSPARLQSNGLTPLPKSLEPLIVMSWVIDGQARTVPVPEYTVKVLAPPAAAGAAARVLKTMNVKPQESWARSKVNDPAPTVEISLK